MPNCELKQIWKCREKKIIIYPHVLALLNLKFCIRIMIRTLHNYFDYIGLYDFSKNVLELCICYSFFFGNSGLSIIHDMLSIASSFKCFMMHLSIIFMTWICSCYESYNKGNTEKNEWWCMNALKMFWLYTEVMVLEQKGGGNHQCMFYVGWPTRMHHCISSVVIPYMWHHKNEVGILAITNLDTRHTCAKATQKFQRKNVLEWVTTPLVATHMELWSFIFEKHE